MTVCCTFCGRDTKRASGICIVCAGRCSSTLGQMKGRKSLNRAELQAIEDMKTTDEIAEQEDKQSRHA